MLNWPVGILFLVRIWLCRDRSKADKSALSVIMELQWMGLKYSFPLLPSEVHLYRRNPLILVTSCSCNVSPDRSEVHPFSVLQKGTKANPSSCLRDIIVRLLLWYSPTFTATCSKLPGEHRGYCPNEQKNKELEGTANSSIFPLRWEAHGLVSFNPEQSQLIKTHKKNKNPRTGTAGINTLS